MLVNIDLNIEVYIMTTLEIVLIAALAVSEALALIPSVKSNSVFQLVYNILKSLKK